MFEGIVVVHFYKILYQIERDCGLENIDYYHYSF